MWFLNNLISHTSHEEHYTHYYYINYLLYNRMNTSFNLRRLYHFHSMTVFLITTLYSFAKNKVNHAHCYQINQLVYQIFILAVICRQHMWINKNGLKYLLVSNGEQQSVNRCQEKMVHQREVESFLPADFVEIHTSIVCFVTRSACIRFESSLPAPVAIIATCSLGNNRFTSVSTRNSCIRAGEKKR